VSVAAVQREYSLARRLRVRVPVNRGAERNADNPESINLQPHRLSVRVQAKREVEEREGKAPMVNPVASQEAERLLQLSGDKGSRSGERKRARGPHRHEDHNNSLLIILAAPEQNPGLLCSRTCVVGRLYQTPGNRLLVVGEAFLISPFFPVCDQTSSNWILSNVVPLFVNGLRRS
jgi:hypothetical protein